MLRLAGREARVTDLTGELGLAQPALPRWLAAAEDLLAATGNAVALCPVYAQGR